MDRDQAQTTAEKILAAHDITFGSVNARGMRSARDGGDTIVKVEIQVNGEIPPDGECIRYYRMRYRSLSGWKVGGRVSVWSYRLKVF